MNMPKHLTLFTVDMLLDCFPFPVNINIADVNITVHILHEFAPLFLLCVHLCYRMGFPLASVDYGKQFPGCLFRPAHHSL